MKSDRISGWILKEKLFEKIMNGHRTIKHLSDLLIVVLMMVVLASCASFKKKQSLLFAKNMLKSPVTVVHNVENIHLLYGVFPYVKEESFFECFCKINSENVDIRLFLPTGQTFLEAFWNGFELDYNSSFIENGMPFAAEIINNFIDLYSNEKVKNNTVISSEDYSYVIEIPENVF